MSNPPPPPHHAAPSAAIASLGPSPSLPAPSSMALLLTITLPLLLCWAPLLGSRVAGRHGSAWLAGLVTLGSIVMLIVVIGFYPKIVFEATTDTVTSMVNTLFHSDITASIVGGG